MYVIINNRVVGSSHTYTNDNVSSDEYDVRGFMWDPFVYEYVTLNLISIE